MRIRDITENKQSATLPEKTGWPETHEEAEKLLKLAKTGIKVKDAKSTLSETKGFDQLFEQLDTYSQRVPQSDFADVLVNFLVTLPATNQAISSMQDAIWADTDLTPMIMPQLQMAEDRSDILDVVSEALHSDLVRLSTERTLTQEDKNKQLLMRSFQSNTDTDDVRSHYLKKFKTKNVLESGKLIDATFSLASDLQAAKKVGKPDRDKLTTLIVKNANKHGVGSSELQEKFKSIYGKRTSIKESQYILESENINNAVKALYNRYNDLRTAGDTGFSTAFHARKIAKDYNLAPSNLITKYNEKYKHDKINEDLINNVEIDLPSLAKDIDSTNQPSGSELKLQLALTNKFGKEFTNWYIQLMDYAENNEFSAKSGANQREVLSYLKRNKDKDAKFIELAHRHSMTIHKIANDIAKEHSNVVQKEIEANKAQDKSGDGSDYKVAEAFGRRVEPIKSVKPTHFKNGDDESDECFNCDGTGIIPHKHNGTCHACKGTGIPIKEDVVDFPGNPNLKRIQPKSAEIKNFPKKKNLINTSIDDMAAWVKWKIDSEIDAGRIKSDNQAVRLQDIIKKEIVDSLSDQVDDPEDAVWQAFMRMYDEGIWYYILDKANLLHTSINESINCSTANRARSHLWRMLRKHVDSSDIAPLSNFESYEDKDYISLKMNVYNDKIKRLESISEKLKEELSNDGFESTEDGYCKDGVKIKFTPVRKTFRSGAYRNRETPTVGIEITGPKKPNIELLDNK